MKNWVLIAFIGLCFLSVDYPTTDITKKGLRGKIKCIIEYDTSYQNYNGFKSKDCLQTTIFRFDQKGNLIAKIINPASPYNYKEYNNKTFKYNNSGQKVYEKEERKCYYIHKNDYDTCSNPATFFVYDSLGSIIIKRRLCDDCGEQKFRYKYDSLGNTIEKSTFENGKLTGIILYQYITPKIVIENWKGENGIIFLGKIIYKYDNNENITEMKNLKPDGKIDYQSIYKYNKRNEIASYEFFPGASYDQKKIYSYDRYNNLTKIKSYSISSGKSGLIIHFKYCYDKKGNWIKRTRIINKESSNLVSSVRVIEYY